MAEKAIEQMWNNAIIFLVTFITRLPSLFTDFYNPDETCYATIGQRLLEGKSLYVDAIDHKPPLIYYFYALFERVSTGNAVIVAHYGAMLSVALTGIVLSAIVKRLGGSDRTSLLAAVLYVIAASLGKPNDVMAANSELFFNLPIALFMFFIVQGRSFKWLFLSGLSVSVAVLIKPHAAVAVFAGVIYLLFYCDRPFWKRLTDVIFLSLGVALPLFAVWYWLFHTQRSSEAWYWVFSVNFLYMEGHEGGTELLMRFLKQTGYMFAEQFGLWFPLIVSLFHKERPRYPLLAWWLAFSFIAVFPGQRFFGHYYLQMLPPLAILSAFSYRNVIFSLVWRRMAVGISVFALASAFFISWIWAWPIEDFRMKMETSENKGLISYLKENAGAFEKIEVWGRFNGIPYLAGRENGSRFLNKNLLSGSFRSRELVKMPESHWDLYFSDLERNRPEWFVDHSAADMRSAPLSKFPKLQEYVSRNYLEVEEIEGSVIYRLRAREDLNPRPTGSKPAALSN